MKLPKPSRRSFIAALGFGLGTTGGRAVARAQSVPAQTKPPSGYGLYRDPARGSVPHAIATLLDSDQFISAYRFFSEEQIADASNFRGEMDLSQAVQSALDGAWSTNRDLFLPAGLYRVRGLRLPGDHADRTRAFRFYGQGSGELFARAKNGGTIIEGTGEMPVLASRQDQSFSGNGNQEVAYIRFEGDSAQPVLDFETFYAQSELHHCGIYQAGSGDGVRVRHANTIELHHNYVLNRDWNGGGDVRRTGVGFRVTTVNDNGLLTLRKNTSRGFEWGYRLGAKDTGRLFSARLEQCEVSVCGNGLYLAEGIQGAVVDNCYFEGGRGGTAILNLGRSNTISNNLVFPGYAVAIDDSAPSRGTLITGNMLSAGNARTMAKGGCTLILLAAQDTMKTVVGNTLICDPVSFGDLNNVVGIDLRGRDPHVDAWPNEFDPAGEWGAGSWQIVDRSGGAGSRGMLPANGRPAMPIIAGAAVTLERVLLDDTRFEGDMLTLPSGSWFEIGQGLPRIVREFDGGSRDGRLVTLWDPHGVIRVEPTVKIRLDGRRTYAGPGLITFLLLTAEDGTEALELSRTNY